MASKAQKVRLSIFLIGAGSLLVVTFLLLVGGRLLRRTDGYEIEYRGVSVSGLEAGAPVKYLGVQVGRVADLSVRDPATIGVTIEVRRGTPVRRDTEAVLAHMGITGQKFVELIGGTEAAGPLEPGGTIRAGSSMLDTIAGQADEILKQTESVLSSLNQLLNPETTAATQRLLVSLAGVAEQTEALLSDTRGSLTSSITRFDTAMMHMAVASARMDSTMEQVAAITARVRTETDSMQIAETMADFRRLLDNSNELVVHGDLLLVQARDDVLRSLVSMEQALDNLREATDIIRDNPSVLLRGRAAEQDGLPGGGP